jgi:hypothetical protein
VAARGSPSSGTAAGAAAGSGRRRRGISATWLAMSPTSSASATQLHTTISATAGSGGVSSPVTPMMKRIWKKVSDTA